MTNKKTANSRYIFPKSHPFSGRLPCEGVVDFFVVAAAVGEEDDEVEGGGVGGHLLEVDAEGGCLAVELCEDPLLVDEAAIFGNA